MSVGRMRVPIGVIGIIYESRPNVTADATSLCLKAGNAVVLRGGSEAIHSNRAIVKILRDAARAEGIAEGAVTFIDIPDREAIMELLKLEGIVDLIIPAAEKPDQGGDRKLADTGPEALQRCLPCLRRP